MGICCGKCLKSGGDGKSLNGRNIQSNRFPSYKDDVGQGNSFSKYRDNYYEDVEEEGGNSGLGGEEGGDDQNNMLSEKQIRDLVQKQLQALHELDEKLNDENQDDDELEEEAFLDEVRRSSPQSRKPKVDDPARALLDLESATNKALNNLENENFDEEFNQFMSNLNDSDDDPEPDFNEGDTWMR